MFSGIVKQIGIVSSLTKEGSNLHIEIESDLAAELHVDQSVAHNGVCLTVTSINGNRYVVTAIEETLLKTNLGELDVGSEVNLECAMKMDGMLDGHIVQGHVDTTATCTAIDKRDGSTYFAFEYIADKAEYTTVEKGSICVNGVSLTVVNPFSSSNEGSTNFSKASSSFFSKDGSDKAQNYFNTRADSDVREDLKSFCNDGSTNFSKTSSGFLSKDGSDKAQNYFNTTADSDVREDLKSLCNEGSTNFSKKTFQVAIIPYTLAHTNFHTFKVGSKVNLEFDILGKYILKYFEIFKEGYGK